MRSHPPPSLPPLPLGRARNFTRYNEKKVNGLPGLAEGEILLMPFPWLRISVTIYGLLSYFTAGNKSCFGAWAFFHTITLRA